VALRIVTSSCLTAGKSKAVGRQNLVHGLEVSYSAALAVARASGRDTLGLSARVERTARVTGLGAHVGLGESSDTALRVVDGCAQGADSTAVDTSGGAGAADAGSGGGGGAAGHGQS
jgi:hypothetical protein